MHSVLFLYVVCGLLFSNVRVKASLVDQMNEEFTSILMQCLKEFPLSSSDLETMTKQQMPEIEAARCMFACAYKRTGMMDEEGKLSAEGVRQLSRKYFSDDPAKMKISDDFTGACLSVNDESVKDGNKGCERAALIFECSVKKAPDFDFL